MKKVIFNFKMYSLFSNFFKKITYDREIERIIKKREIKMDLIKKDFEIYW